MQIGKELICENPQDFGEYIKHKRLVDKALMVERFTNYKILNVDVNRKGSFLLIECWSKYKRDKIKIQVS